MRHQADHVAALVGDAGDVAQRAVGVVVEVAGDHAALPLEPVERRLVGDEPALAVLEHDGDLVALVVRRGPRGRGVLDAEPLVAADELAVVVADQRTRQQVGLAQDLEAVADAEHRHPPPGCLDDLGHDRREPADRTAAEVVAVGEAARQHDRVDPAQVVVAVPQRDRLVATDPDRALGVGVVERTREGDDPDLHSCDLDVHREVLDHRVGEEGPGHLLDRGEHLGGDLAVDLELEPLALAHVADAGEAEPRQRAEHRLALGVEDLRLGHHVDDDTGHGATPEGRRRKTPRV